MFCGTRSFSQMDGGGGNDKSPRNSSKKLRYSSSCSDHQHKGSRKHTNNSKKNPYSSMGLDKFEKVLAELEAKKESILSRAKSQGSEGATVRFTYRPETEDWIPIIIKQREEKREEEDNVDGGGGRGETTKTPRAKGTGGAKRLSAPPSFRIEKGVEGDHQVVVKKRKKRKNGKCKYSWGGGCMYWALVMVLVLVALIFGRSFAICWTTMWWYMVPMVKERRGINNLRRKELRKRFSENKLGAHEGHANYGKRS